MIQTDQNPVLSLSPSFNSYTSSSKLSLEPQAPASDDSPTQIPAAAGHVEPSPPADSGSESDFEFAVAGSDPDGSIIAADDIFYDGQIRTSFPLFDRSLLLLADQPDQPATPARRPLGKLMLEERDASNSSSSSSSSSESEPDELEGIPPGTYCLWKPRPASTAAPSPDRCRKSNSTGSSRRWRLRDLMRRSHSDGAKERLVAEEREKRAAEASKEGGPNSGDRSGKGNEKTVTHFLAEKDGDRRRSFLPYRKDLMGLFSNGRDPRTS